MSTMLKEMNYVLTFLGLSKDSGKAIDPTGSILFPLKPYKGFVASLSCLLS
jgi:hypothetical protein